MNTRPQIAAYYFPNWHVDPRNERIHGPGWTEWEVVKCARPRFPGHRQPKIPLAGYEDEADPAVMAKKIALAADHGIDAFIFDWYHYDGAPFRQRALEDGLLKASNNSRIKFAIMWCNHDGRDLHPAKERDPSPYDAARILYPGAVNAETFDLICDYCIRNYFTHSSYWTVDGVPYFSIYDLSRLIAGLGGRDTTRRALERFRAKTRAAGFSGLHLNGIVLELAPLPGETAAFHPETEAAALGFDSLTDYVWVHHYKTAPSDFPEVDYNIVRDGYFAAWRNLRIPGAIPRYPCVTMGWDASPRTLQSDIWSNLGYPSMYCIKNNTPENFASALRLARDELPRRDLPAPFISINAWNEWTEGSYLEPDTIHGTAFLEAIRDVFPLRQKP
ncbi:MAG: glycoside hydrolase family 99-like domain-containing protein [Opitutaceae bacterium]|jgi:hypothetical protein|nr:glycoside hydrolase family 99-like domain-containing protein [Opitutaceae bacterium]